MANKTKKYYFSFSTYNIDGEWFEITQKKYNEMLKAYKKAVDENHKINNENDTEYFVKCKETIKELDTRIITTTTIIDGASYLMFKVAECKKGFVFVS